MTEEKRLLISNCLFIVALGTGVLMIVLRLPFWPSFLVAMGFQVAAIWVRASS
ncbi:MAG: hypothetical protein PSV23_10520 [Brevundimonas sp.]|uniref:hypothetical protein n=1 Tax=Brevundimonas sp. TaxID=1871086 RepID=UPI00248967C4|nr:hypothetical protein [Brevundimonas sp.]MDI1327218.1 hypothetical protein [Brevundimonas sp.]